MGNLCGKSTEHIDPQSTEQIEPLAIFQAQDGTRFGHMLKTGAIAVIKSGYFFECEEQGEPFQHRALIPRAWIFTGEEAFALWLEHGYKFLLILSHAWLSPLHPDPDGIHLKQLTRVMKEMITYHGIEELGAIVDFCSLWQKGSPDGDIRTTDQKQQFVDGLGEFNTGYAHRDLTAVKLTSTPGCPDRSFDDRGWTLFESIVIDGKGPSSERDLYGERNVLSFSESFNPETERTKGEDFVGMFSGNQRRPPLTPERFQEELEKRRRRAEEKGVALFTNGKDNSFVQKKYAAVFEESIKTAEFDFFGMGFGDDELADLMLVAVRCKGLQRLGLFRNKLESLPESIGQLAALQELDLSDNKLASLPESIGQLAALQTLYLRENKLASLPESIGRLVGLQKLYLSANQLASLPESIGQLAALQKLKLSDNKLESLPESIGQLAALQELDIRYNKFASLPESIGRLAALQKLDLSDNKLESLLESIGQLAALQELDIHSNKLASLPESIGRLVGLQKLDLAYNQLESLPESIGQQAALQKLDLSDNQLESLPESIGQLAALQELYLSDNQLESLPESIGQLAALQELDICSNKLASLPECVGGLTANVQTLAPDF